MRKQKLLNIIDLETTGLDYWRHEIIEISLAPVNVRTLEVEGDIYTRKVFPVKIQTASPEALEINGYDEEVWAEEAIPLREMLLEIQPLVKGNRFGGQNPGFDYGFLKYGFRQEKISFPFMDRRMIDTASLAMPLLSLGYIDSLSLATLCEYFGIERRDAHTAESDVLDTLDVLKALMPDLGAFQHPNKITNYAEIKQAMLAAMTGLHESFDKGVAMMKDAMGHMMLQQKMFYNMMDLETKDGSDKDDSNTEEQGEDNG